MVRRRFFPGVMTCWRCPRGIQVARTQGSRLTWVSSSASTTAPAGRPRRWRCRSARTWSRSGSPLATRRRPQRRGGAGSAGRWRGGPVAATAVGWSRRLAAGGAAGCAGRGWGCPAVVGRPALLGEQDHEQAAGQAVGAVQQAQQVARVGGRAGRFGVHAGGTHTSGGLVGSLWSQAPTTGEATSSAIGLTAAPGLRAELLVSRLDVDALVGRGNREAGAGVADELDLAADGVVAGVRLLQAAVGVGDDLELVGAVCP